MNKYILCVLDRKNKTEEELDINAVDAAHAAADDAAYASAYWINEYFKRSGENKQDYFNAVNKDNKQ